VERSGKQSAIIHTFECKDKSPAAHTICLCLQKKFIGGALDTLTSSSNANDSDEFLLLVKSGFGCDQKVTDAIQYNDIAEGISAQNAIGYLAYFLIKNDLPACGAIKQNLQAFSQKEEQEKLFSKKMVAMEAENQSLKEGLTIAKQTQQEQERVIRQLNREKGELESNTQKQKEQTEEIESLNVKIKELLKSNEDLKAQIDQLKEDEKSRSNNKFDGIVERTSLFLLQENSTGRFLQRVADLDGGHFTRFIKDCTKENRFDNRDYFAFQMKRFDRLNIGVAQIFDWRVQPKQQDPTKDEADVVFQSVRQPIELIDLHAQNGAAALQNLKEGFQWLYFEGNGPYFYVISHRADGTMEALFCPKGTLIRESDTIHIGPNVVSLEQYSLEKEDLLAIPLLYSDSEMRIFYTKLGPGEPKDRIILHTPAEMAARYVRDYATDTNLKSIISGRQNWQAFRSFINAEHVELICGKIASEYGLKKEEARVCLNNSLDQIEQYLSGTDEDTQLVSTLVERNPTLREKYKAIVQEEWEKENADKLKTTGEQLTAQSTLLQGAQREREKLSKEIRIKQDELITVEQEINSKRKLGEDTLRDVRQKISEARKNTAGFLAELSVYFPQSETVTAENGKNKESAMYHEGLQIGEGLAEEKDSVSNSLDVLCENMENAGVNGNYAYATAAWLLSAYCEHVPLLLAGPSTDQLADAASRGINRCVAARLTCAGEWNQEVVNQAVKSNSKIVLIENPFRGEWMERMPPLALNSKKLFLFATPFSEDLAIEPKGLYQYIFPVFTDFIISALPKKPGINSVWDGRVPELKGNAEGIYRMSFLKPTGLLKTQANRLFRRFENLLKKPADFYEFLLCILPLAIATGHGQEAADEIGNSARLNDDERKFLLALLG
jgi:seryl-tRNA synthetase